MLFLKKYLLFILLLANITAEYLLLAPISQVFFYSVLALSIPIIILNGRDFSLSMKCVPDIKWIIFIYLIAQFVFQQDILSIENILYTITKVIVFCIITSSLYSNYKFYLHKAPLIFSFIIVVLVLGGWFVNKTGYYGGLQFGFANRNVACTAATAGIAGFLFIRKKLSVLDFACMAFLFITILYGGSRNALAMCLLIVAFRYGLSFKLVTVGALLFATVMYVLPEMGIEITAFNRLMGTFDGSVSVDREEVRNIAMQMIALRPWTGWGYNFTIPSYIGINMGAHNGYLSMIEILGYPCGIAVLAIIIIGSIRRLGLYRLKNSSVNYFLAIVVSTLFAANQESYLVGVNQFTTNYYFVAYVALGMYKHKSVAKYNS